MRGLPPLQALLLLIALAVLGLAGKSYIGTGTAVSKVAATPIISEQNDTIEAEIQFTFSSPPASYTLTQPGVTGKADKVLLDRSQPRENPCYETIHFISHQAVSYWLDVVWPEDCVDGAHHFVQIHISPVHGQSKRFSFYSRSKSINETIEYDCGEHHHHHE